MRKMIQFIIMVIVLLLSNQVILANHDKTNLMDFSESSDDKIERVFLLLQDNYSKPLYHEYYVGIEGIPQEDHKSAHSGWITTQVHIDYLGTLTHPIVEIETQARQICDDQFNILDYESIKFHAYDYIGIIMNKNIQSYRLFPNNVKLVYSVFVLGYFGGYEIIHDYNLHGHGVYDLVVHNDTYDWP